MTDTRRRAIAYALLVVAAGLNLRDPITSIAATLGSVTSHFGLSPLGAAVLSSLPVVMLAVGAPLAPSLERRFGTDRALLGLSVLLALSVALRPVSSLALFTGTVVAGLSISGLSVLVPQLIREHLGRRAGLWSGVFSTSFGVSAAVGAGVTVPLVASTGSLPMALALWAIPAVVLVAVAAVSVGPRPAQGSEPVAGSGNRSRLLWQVTAFFGAQALVFFAVTAWLTTIYTDRGTTPGHAAGLLALASIAGLPGSLGISVLAGRMPRQHWLVIAVSVGTAIGLTGVVWAPVDAAPVFVTVLGFAQGATFGLAMALIVLKADGQVARFSAFAQGVGFAVAALGPLLLGVSRWAGLSWSPTGVFLIGVVALQAIAGWAAGRHVVRITQLQLTEARS